MGVSNKQKSDWIKATLEITVLFLVGMSSMLPLIIIFLSERATIFVLCLLFLFLARDT